jgi:hypothetical protein
MVHTDWSSTRRATDCESCSMIFETRAGDSRLRFLGSHWLISSSEPLSEPSLLTHRSHLECCVGGPVSWANNSALMGGTEFGYNQRPPPRPTDQCTTWMRNYCAPEMQGRGVFLEWDVNNAAHHAETMAAFLVTRPPVGFTGSYRMRGPGELGPSHGKAFSPLFLLDVGQPLEWCQEIEPSAFQRKWSKGYAQLDCSTYHAGLSFQFVSEQRSEYL